MIVVGFGGNIGTRAELLDRFAQARDTLGAMAVPGSLRSAPVYRSAPIGPLQPDYLNTAIALELAADVTPREVEGTLAVVEQALGRRRETEERWGPRPLDLDVLVWDDRVLTAPLVVPHPRLCERKFALAPLVDLVGEGFAIPGHGRAGDCLRAVAAQDATVIASTW
jgi:2-amino-4-hydroxy-6-hydroxymethyldihydropteridine diphosphokinase